MICKVLLTDDAARDLEDLHRYIAEQDSPAAADHVLDRIEKVFQNLAAFPERGNHPKELVSLGLREYRETFFKPYRVIYRVIGKGVYVYLIADGRRDMQTLLARRLL
ncbi:MAG: type II toxin-antitoxin system RelE/ParE family toxin [Gammaproteobacteria bacterium]|nr:type II toxin-antitoxin system RelE/ParE family toxin [Gammaproteobacteria bacterium]